MPRVSESLIRVFEERAKTLRSLATLATRHGMRSQPDGIRVDVVLRDERPDIATAIAASGGTVHSVSRRHHRASVTVGDADALRRIAALPQVLHVYPAYAPILRAGSVTSRAVEAQAVDSLPGGLTGNGIRIGILSDSFARTADVVDTDDSDGTQTTTNGTAIDPNGNSSPVTLENTLPQQSDDLPDRIELRRDDATGSLVDEGAAMAELAHDIAPDASIAFHSAFVSFGEFAAGFDDLCDDAGVDVVVDDVVYVSELMYQRDVISREAEDCVATGVAAFSSAGNNGDSAFRHAYVDVNENDTNENGASAVFGNDFHDWDPNAGGDDLLRIRLENGDGFSAVLQWNQPALSTPENTNNGPRIDLDVYLLDGSGRIIERSTTDQRANDDSSGADPVEFVRYRNTSGGARNVYLGIDHWAGRRDGIPQDDGTRLEFRLVFFETGNPSYEYTPRDSTMFGHTVADGVISVGAVPWWEAPAFDPVGNGPTAAIDPEPFTALGGRLEHHFRPDGTFFRRTLVPQPWLAASDGNNTTFFGQTGQTPAIDGEDDAFPNFFGTSAAAPNAAAVAALLLQNDGALLPSELVAGLMTSAVDVTGRNATAGCDDRTGAGLIDAAAALSASDTPPQARAGGDQDSEPGRTVTLDGSASTDDEGVERFQWTQVRGPRVSLSNPDGAQTGFNAPRAGGTLVFELRVVDAACLSDSDRVTVDVKADDGGGSVGPWHLLGLLLLTLVHAHSRACHRSDA